LILEIRNLIKEIRNIKDKWLWKMMKTMWFILTQD
jgi:hypothetical protein